MKYAPYSYSKLETFKTCPYKFKLTYIDKIKVSSDNIALEKGNFIHYLLEHYPSTDYSGFKFNLLQQTDITSLIELYNKIINITKVIMWLKAECIGIEVEFALDKKLNPVGYWDDTAVIRGKIDRVIKTKHGIEIIDWKTGKYKDPKWIPTIHQCTLYALWFFKQYNDIDFVTTHYYYVEHNKTNTYTFTRDKISEYSKGYGSQIVNIEKESEFNKNIHKLCDWCDYKSSGICVN